MNKWVAAAVATACFAGTAHAQVGGFRDVPSGHWAAGALEALAARAIVGPAKPKGNFDGAKPVTRYELAVTLWKLVQYMERADKQKKSKDGASAPVDG
ncbi:MAG: S-layer homology domain-containing protein, partial [Armatimonadota bacterium]